MHTRHVGATLCNPNRRLISNRLGRSRYSRRFLSLPLGMGSWMMDATLHLPSSAASEKVVWNGRAA